VGSGQGGQAIGSDLGFGLGEEADAASVREVESELAAASQRLPYSSETSSMSNPSKVRFPPGDPASLRVAWLAATR
jgi:hypothetical protein